MFSLILLIWFVLTPPSTVKISIHALLSCIFSMAWRYYHLYKTRLGSFGALVTATKEAPSHRYLNEIVHAGLLSHVLMASCNFLRINCFDAWWQFAVLPTIIFTFLYMWVSKWKWLLMCFHACVKWMSSA